MESETRAEFVQRKKEVGFLERIYDDRNNSKYGSQRECVME